MDLGRIVQADSCPVWISCRISVVAGRDERISFSVSLTWSKAETGRLSCSPLRLKHMIC